MKTISILLTKYSDWISCFLYHISGRGYTHVSLSLSDNEDLYYSFNYHGFCIETLEKHRKRGVKKSLCYHIQISDAAYEEIQKKLHLFEAHRNDFQYTRLGLLFAILHIPFFRWKNRYFCSQFVAELLIHSGAVPLQKSANLYLPNQLPIELERCSGLKRVSYNII